MVDHKVIDPNTKHRQLKIFNAKMYVGFVLLVLVLFADCTISTLVNYANIPEEIKTGNPNDEHGGIKMGIRSDYCDNAKDLINVDWDNSEEDYTCYKGTFAPANEVKITKTVDPHEKSPTHVCLPDPIIYEEAIPTSGSHRPLWPMYGEYLYLPPQRWVHSLEHGAAVFLYHPCVDKKQLKLFKEIAFKCLKKIIITPYKKVPEEQPFVVVTYQAKLMMNTVKRDTIEKFIQENVWQRSQENHVWKDGMFSAGLIKSSYNRSVFENNYNVICSKHFDNTSH